MYTGLYAAVSGGMAQEQRLAILTNNLANAATVGYKADRPIFRVSPLPVVVGPVQVPGAPHVVTTAVSPLLGQDSPQHRLTTVYTDFSQGPIRETGNPLDLALEGPGFFVIEGPHGPLYTRQGNFTLNAEGFLVTQNGFLVQGERGPLHVRGQRVVIDATGRVQVDGQVVDRLKLVDFPRPYPLEKVGNALFRATTTPPPEQVPTALLVHQGALEQSNSDPLRLLGAVLQTSRAYEAYQKVIQAFDEVARRAANDLASLA